MVRGIYWAHEGSKWKYMDMPELEVIDSVWTPTK